MRFMVIVKATKDSEAGKMPSEDMLAARSPREAASARKCGTVAVACFSRLRSFASCRSRIACGGSHCCCSYSRR